MRVFVAGATGAIGRLLVRQLRDHGHEVVGMTRDPARGEKLREAGATPVVGDATDRDLVKRAVAEARPDVIVNELTDLPASLDPKRLAEIYAANDRVRRDGTAALLAAAGESEVTRFISQSSAFWYAPTPGDVKTEDDPFDTDAPEPSGTSVRTMRAVEETIRAAPGLAGTILRYATLYGPGTWYEPDGEIGRRFRKWMYPIIGSGAAVMSFVHVEDAAAATVAAVEAAIPGTFNVADDEPARARDWMPAFAAAIGARRPLRVPVAIARLAAPPALVHLSTNSRGASNRRIRDALGWAPEFTSWRTGFTAGLTRDA